MGKWQMCPPCKGTGKYGKEDCDTCHGLGTLERENDWYEPEVIECWTCHGSGKSDKDKPCIPCDGRGWIKKD